MLALSLGPTPLDLPDDVADVCEAVAWFRDTELSYTVASTENLKAWAQVPGRFFEDMVWNYPQDAGLSPPG